MNILYIPFFLTLLFTDLKPLTPNSETMITPDLPYHDIESYPDSYTPENVAARIVDGLGFRYYWATEGLREEDLAYKPSEEGRTTAETLDHILGLSFTILNAPQSKPNTYQDLSGLSWEEKRKLTLENIYNASQLLKNANEGDIENMKAIFGQGENTSEYPFWNMLNGPISDAIYHVGQVVSFRRSSGNPIPSGVRMLTGKANVQK